MYLQPTGPAAGDSVGGTDRANFNAGDTAHPGQPTALPATRPATSSALGGTAHQTVAIDPGAGGSAASLTCISMMKVLFTL
jgi:N-acetylmuramoyl-L-alanine amidase